LRLLALSFTRPSNSLDRTRLVQSVLVTVPPECGSTTTTKTQTTNFILICKKLTISWNGFIMLHNRHVSRNPHFDPKAHDCANSPLFSILPKILTRAVVSRSFIHFTGIFKDAHVNEHRHIFYRESETCVSIEQTETSVLKN